MHWEKSLHAKNAECLDLAAWMGWIAIEAPNILKKKFLDSHMMCCKTTGWDDKVGSAAIVLLWQTWQNRSVASSVLYMSVILQHQMEVIYRWKMLELRSSHSAKAWLFLFLCIHTEVDSKMYVGCRSGWNVKYEIISWFHF